MTTSSITFCQNLYDAFARRDLDTILATVTAETVIEQSPGLPWSGTHRGTDGVTAFFGTLLGHLETELDVEDLFDAGDAVVQVGRTRGRILANGNQFDVREIHLLEIRDQKLISLRVWVDVPAMQAALAGKPSVTAEGTPR